MTQHCILYDGKCPMCAAQMKVLARLDWRGAFRLLPLADPQVEQIAPQLSGEGLREAIHCVTAEGRVYEGARALRFAGLRLPLLVPVALLLWVPGVIVLADFAYRRVSRNRMFLSRVFGCTDTCAVPPGRERGPEQGAQAAGRD